MFGYIDILILISFAYVFTIAKEIRPKILHSLGIPRNKILKEIFDENN